MFSYFLYPYTSCDHIIIWLPYCIYICVPASVNYSLKKAAVGCWNIWITVSVLWLVQQIDWFWPFLLICGCHDDTLITSSCGAESNCHTYWAVLLRVAQDLKLTAVIDGNYTCAKMTIYGVLHYSVHVRVCTFLIAQVKMCTHTWSSIKISKRGGWPVLPEY